MHNQNLIKNLHPIKRKDPLTIEIADSVGSFYYDLEVAVDDLYDQFDIDTATWGLKIYEKALGITASVNDSYESRREVIKAKERGNGQVDRALIEITAESFSNGEVDVFFNGTIEIKFIGEKGVPQRIDNLKQAIENIKPAHLPVRYTFRYLTWDEFENYNKTWDEWDILNLTWNELEAYTE